MKKVAVIEGMEVNNIRFYHLAFHGDMYMTLNSTGRNARDSCTSNLPHYHKQGACNPPVHLVNLCSTLALSHRGKSHILYKDVIES